MKVGIIGHKGFVGSAFLEVFSADKNCEAVGIGRENYSAHKGGKFDVLINANGNSSKRLADSDPMRDFEMNAVESLRFISDFSFTHYVHLSTVEVYNSRHQPSLCREDSPINPSQLSNYGFSKYLSELIAARCESHLILRLAGMVGNRLSKGPAYDILHLRKLFVSSASEYQFLHTSEVASVAKKLIESKSFGQAFNLVGGGSIKLSSFAEMAGVKLIEEGREVQQFRVPNDKLGSKMKISTSEQTVRSFIAAQKNKKQD